MKIALLRTHDMTCEPVVGGLESLDQHVISELVYDRDMPVDHKMLDAADNIRPDAILYIGSNDPRLMASEQTFRKLRKIAPLAMLAFDGSDASWVAPLQRYREQECFNLVVNIDGNDEWPKGPKDYTAITPTDPRPFARQGPLGSRPVRFGFAGGYSSPSRREIVEFLRDNAGLVIPPRNENYGSYAAYARFLTQCQIVLNVPWSGNEQMQVKGRVVEAGMAGCCLLEMEGAPTEKWFGKGSYVSYKNKEEIAECMQELLSYPPTEISFIADDLQHEVREKYAPIHFWSNLLGVLL